MKKHIYLFLSFCFLLAWKPAVSQVFKNKDLQITQLEDKMWVIVTSDNTTMYLLEGNDKALLIDTGTNCDSLDFIIRKITQKPLQVVITHMHLDHAGNINYFPEIYFHPADTVLMSRLKPYPGKMHFVKDGDVFDLGGKIIEVRHMPAHTPGSIVLVDKQDGDCFTGDAFGSGQVWLQLWPYSTMETYINSCTKMLKLMDEGIERIYCGHYPYSNGALTKDYVVKMKELATDLNNGTVKDCQPYNIIVSISCPKPMLYAKDNIGIVYDPDHIKF